MEYAEYLRKRSQDEKDSYRNKQAIDEAAESAYKEGYKDGTFTFFIAALVGILIAIFLLSL
jgi:hypothetical protein